MNILRVSTFEEPPLQASKWLQIQLLIDSEEMVLLFNFLQPFHLFICGAATPKNQGEITHRDFLNHYETYINALKKGILPAVESYQKWFSAAMSTSSDALYTIPIDHDRQLIRISQPIIQMQSHTIDYSPFDKKFRSMVHGSQVIPWGIQFSYPQLYQDPTTKQIHSTRNDPQFPNSQLFHQLQKWIRQHTTPTSFLIDNKVHTIPIRLGKHCEWINCHPRLIEKGIMVQR
jgi:hypothetical protein